MPFVTGLIRFAAKIYVKSFNREITDYKVRANSVAVKAGTKIAR